MIKPGCYRIYLLVCCFATAYLVLVSCTLKTVDVNQYIWDKEEPWKDFVLPVYEPRDEKISEDLTNIIDSMMADNLRNGFIPGIFRLEYSNNSLSFSIKECSFDFFCERKMPYKGVYVFSHDGVERLLFIKNFEGSNDMLFVPSGRKIRFHINVYLLPKGSALLYRHNSGKFMGSIKRNRIVLDSILTIK